MGHWGGAWGWEGKGSERIERTGGTGVADRQTERTNERKRMKINIRSVLALPSSSLFLIPLLLLSLFFPLPLEKKDPAVLKRRGKRKKKSKKSKKPHSLSLGPSYLLCYCHWFVRLTSALHVFHRSSFFRLIYSLARPFTTLTARFTFTLKL